MKLKFTFIFFCLILSVISLNLKKKNENKKSLNGIRAFLKTKMGESYKCKDPRNKKINYRVNCHRNDHCFSNKCGSDHRCMLLEEGRSCECDNQCQTGHCSFHYWAFTTHYRCTKD